MPSIEDQVAALTERLAVLEERVGMEAGLRASGDRDLAAMGQAVIAVRNLVQVVSITQTEQGVTLAGHSVTLARLSATVDKIERTQGEHGAAMGQIVSLLDELIRRDNERPAPGGG